MKRIVEMCSKCQDGSVVQDAVKLRLRGKGSGYKEGPFNKGKNIYINLINKRIRGASSSLHFL
jgi:hypothetical protein